MKIAPIILFALFCFTAKAQRVQIIATPGTAHSKPELFVSANFFPMGEQSFGFIIANGKTFLNINHVIEQDSMVNLKKADILHSEIVIKLDNDSLMYFLPSLNMANVLDINCTKRLVMDAEISNYELLAFRDHMVVSLKLMNETGKAYSIFNFTKENKLSIQNAVVCFLDKKDNL